MNEGFVSFLQETIEFLRNYENNENIRIGTAPTRSFQYNFTAITLHKYFR